MEIRVKNQQVALYASSEGRHACFLESKFQLRMPLHPLRSPDLAPLDNFCLRDQIELCLQHASIFLNRQIFNYCCYNLRNCRYLRNVPQYMSCRCVCIHANVSLIFCDACNSCILFCCVTKRFTLTSGIVNLLSVYVSLSHEGFVPNQAFSSNYRSQ